jgi:hypothetical protein
MFLLLALAAPLRTARAADAQAFAVDDEVRVRRSDAALARARGQALGPGARVELSAMRGETVAFQVVVLAADRDLQQTSLSLPPLSSGGDAPALPVELFREHYLRVDGRSRNDARPAESLGWTPGARPQDARVRGEVPDALLPIALAAAPVAPGAAVPAGQTGAFWIDVFVPETARPGGYRAEATVTADGATLARFDVRVDVRGALLPFRATGAFVYYEAERLDRRLGDGAAVERQLWQLLHAHHLDALAPLSRPEDVARLSSVYDGSLFAEAAGYVGPGAGVPPSVVALGSYGILGEPTPDTLGRVDAMAAALPGAIDDVFLYAIDEQCKSPRAGAWKAALATRPAGARVRVGHTCDEPPEHQAVDGARLPAPAFPRGAPAAARDAGRRAWIYNGALPRTGTFMLDAQPLGLVADGWIAAAFGIERWFYWESIFWDDDNKGGRGAIDPFIATETFHNADGDTALGDGLLLYPGRQRPPFETHSLGVAAVFPSIRLKSLRRGIQDAGLVALATRDAPEETRRIVLAAMPAALDEAPPARPPFWEAEGATFGPARAALRALVTTSAPLPHAQARAAFDALAASRAEAVPLAPKARARGRLGAAAMLAAILALGVLVTAASRRRRTARRAEPRGQSDARTRRS